MLIEPHIITRRNGCFSRSGWSEGQRDSLPEEFRHESGGSERSRIRRSGRGSVVLQEGAPLSFTSASVCGELRINVKGVP